MARWLCVFLLLASANLSAHEADTCFTSQPVPDSIFQRMLGRSYKQGRSIRREELRYLRLSYCDAEGQTRQGQMVCNRAIAADLVSIFRQLWEAHYRIERMQLIDDFDADDQRSMQANNTSCFNHRTVSGTQTLSRHGRGMAVDLNPLYNPYVRGSRVEPSEGRKWAFRRHERRDIPYKIDRRDLAYRIFRQHGFRWGGDWRTCKDYQHFEK